MRKALADRLLLSEALELVGRMVDSIPNGRAAITDSYLGSMAGLLCQYPRMVALRCADPIRGVIRKTKFVPTVSEVVEWCEPLTADLQRTVSREEAVAKQLRERDEWERGAADPPKQTIEELRLEMRRGFPMGGQEPHKETPASVMAKYGISQAQFDAIPNAPPPGHWQQLVDAHRRASAGEGADG